MPKEDDIYYMRLALDLARRGLGRTWPNPSVGCVIVKNGHIISKARTADGGRPHAERQAVDKAGDKCKDACAYVSLEPCSHIGQTQPCAHSLINSGVSRVVVACTDPDPRVRGRGVDMLREAGIDVVEGICEEEALALNAGFFYRVEKGRPFVALKTATSLDGKISTKTGESKWITGDLARHKVHHIRSCYDAILVGINTVKEDDPALTTRIDGYQHDNVAIVLDIDLELPMGSQLVAQAKDRSVWVFTNDTQSKHAQELEERGVRLFFIENRDLKPVMTTLAEEGITRLFVEGGAYIHGAFLDQGYCDKLYYFRAPRVFGGDACAGFSAFSIEKLKDSFDFERIKTMSLGQDMLEIYKKGA